MKLTINQVTDRIGFIKAIRKLMPDLSLQQSVDLANNIPYVQGNIWHDDSLVNILLKDVCIFSYQREPGEWGTCIPPWDKQDYIDAESWYKTLSEEDRRKIDILVKGNVPWG